MKEFFKLWNALASIFFAGFGMYYFYHNDYPKVAAYIAIAIWLEPKDMKV